MHPTMVDEDTGRMIERTRDVLGTWYYKKREYDGHTAWVAIRNTDGYLRMTFRQLRDALDWMMGHGTHSFMTLSVPDPKKRFLVCKSERRSKDCDAEYSGDDFVRVAVERMVAKADQAAAYVMKSGKDVFTERDFDLLWYSTTPDLTCPVERELPGGGHTTKRFSVYNSHGG